MLLRPPSPLEAALMLLGAGRSGGATVTGLQPPTEFDYEHTNTGIDVQIDYTWEPPSSGPEPDAYFLVFESAPTGQFELTIQAQDAREAQVQGMPYNEYWEASLYSRLDSVLSATAAELSAATPDNPYYS